MTITLPKLTVEVLTKFFVKPGKPLADWLDDKDIKKICSLQAPADATFKNGNMVIDYSRPNQDGYDLFAIVSPSGEFVKVLQGYEARNPEYIERIDSYIIPGHDDVKIVFSDGDFETIYVR